MTMKNTLSSLALVALLGTFGFAAGSKAKAKVLGAGRYSAKVKAIVCDACAPKILETVRKFPGVEDASVDQGKSQLSFSVKPGAKVSLATLQAKLKAASEEEGMGADYSLSDLKKQPVKSKK